MEQSSSSQKESEKADENPVSDEETHPFAEPWEDSDVVLVVEDDKFHVHRQILSIHSPVFKAMLSSQFREATAKEIPLPKKKANEVLNFLKQLYVKERAVMTLDKVEHLLKLADEYQAMSVFDICVKYLENVPRYNETVVKILYLVQSTPMARADSRLHSIYEKCLDVIQNMDLKEITQTFDFRNLNRDSLENVFIKRVNRLETFLAKVYPQFIGLLEFCIALCLSGPIRNDLIACPEHFGVHDDTAKEELFQRVKRCLVCRKMIEKLVSASKLSYFPTSEERRYGGTLFFDEELISILEDFHEIIRVPDFSTSRHPMSGPHGPTGLGAYTKGLALVQK